RTVRLWDATTGKELGQWSAHDFKDANIDVHSVAFGPKDQGLSGGGDGNMILWDLNTGKKTGVFPCPAGGAIRLNVAYLEKAKLAATSGNHQPVRLWDLETGKEVGTVYSENHPTYSYCDPRFAPDGK